MARAEGHKAADEMPEARGAAAAARARRGDAEPAAETAVAPAGPAALARRLAAEVDALKAELADARARLVLLEASAERDPVTGALNRRGFERELTRSLAYVRRYGTAAALVFIDLDAFKPVNDRYGHAAGDAMLAAVAAALASMVRASDVVARIGGDEFAVLLWNCGAPDAAAKAQALEQAVAATVLSWNGHTVRIGASAGSAPLLADDDPAGVLGRADQAMYARKSARRRDAAAAALKR